MRKHPEKIQWHLQQFVYSTFSPLTSHRSFCSGQISEEINPHPLLKKEGKSCATNETTRKINRGHYKCKKRYITFKKWKRCNFFFWHDSRYYSSVFSSIFDARLLLKSTFLYSHYLISAFARETHRVTCFNCLQLKHRRRYSQFHVVAFTQTFESTYSLRNIHSEFYILVSCARACIRVYMDATKMKRKKHETLRNRATYHITVLYAKLVRNCR